MVDKSRPGFHRCQAGAENIVMAPSLEISMIGNSAALSLEGWIEGVQVRIAIEINACPMCLEPLTPLGRTLDRMKRAEGII